VFCQYIVTILSDIGWLAWYRSNPTFLSMIKIHPMLFVRLLYLIHLGPKLLSCGILLISHYFCIKAYMLASGHKNVFCPINPTGDVC